jgi:hypothetical protein
MYVVLILFVYFYLLVPLILIPCIVKMYVCIVPVTQLQREQRVIYISQDFPLHIVGVFFSIPSAVKRVFRRGTRYVVCFNNIIIL